MDLQGFAKTCEDLVGLHGFVRIYHDLQADRYRALTCARCFGGVVGPEDSLLNLSEIMPRGNPSGDRVKLLAGLITIEDS